MKIYLKKVLTIGFLIISMGSTLIYGADDKPILKLEDAVKAAFTYSNQLSLNAKEKELLREKLKANQSNAYEAYQKVYLEKAKNENDTEVLKDQITYDMTNRYDKIVTAKKEEQLLDHTIAVKSKELAQMKVKKEMGKMSTIDYEKAELELAQLKVKKQAKLEFLNHEMSFFKLITGKDLVQYTLEDDLTFEVFRVPGNLERYMDTTITTYLKYDRDLAQFTRDHVIIAGGQPIFYGEYLEKQYLADKTLASLEDARKNMKDMLMKSYSSLMSLEEHLAALEIQKQLAEKEIQLSKLKYETGKITYLIYEKQILHLETLDFQRHELITQYNILRQLIQKPWAAVISG